MSNQANRYVDEASAIIGKLNSPIVRWFLRISARKCGDSGKLHLENAFDKYLGKKTRFCPTCSLTSYFVRDAINRGSHAFGILEEDIEELLTKTSTRRGLVSTINGIGCFGVSKPQVVGAPFLVVWNFTNSCNLKCVHCYQEAKSKVSPDELTTQEALNVVDQLNEARVVALSFSGGEPLTRKDFFQVAKYAHDNGLFISVATNGTLITEAVANKMKDAGVEYVEVSLDGSVASTHDSFRGIAGAFKQTLKGIENCKKTGIYTCLATTLTKYNLKEIPDIVQLSKNLRVDRFMLFNFIPTGRGKNILKQDVSPEEREQVLKDLYQELKSKVTNEESTDFIECFTTAPQFARVAIQDSTEGFIPVAHQGGLPAKVAKLAEFIGGCGAGRVYCALQPNGDVTPCVFMPIKLGNLRTENLQDIWFKSPVLKELRDRNLLEGRCHDCDYRNICGGCRARAYSYYGNYLAPDPGCIRELEVSSAHFASKKSSS